MSKGYAIITGAVRGLGKAMFLQLASAGYDLIGVYTSEKSDPKMQALVEQVEKKASEPRESAEMWALPTAAEPLSTPQ